jgi:cytochrome c553
LMPAGLLDKLRDDDIADLYAYLKSLARDARPGESR